MPNEFGGIPVFGETPLANHYGETVKGSFDAFNKQAKEEPHKVGLFAAQALDTISSEGYAVILELESRINKLESQRE